MANKRALNSPFSGSYQDKTVLVTGHTGFKGAWLSFWLHKLGAKVHGYALSETNGPATYSALNISKILSSEVLEDLNKDGLFQKKLNEIKPDIIFHLAAQSLVRYSYKNPMETLMTNFMGTARVLESLRFYKNECALVSVTSDKCYLNQEKDLAYAEDDPMGGYDVYSMSKGACELLISSYRNSFFHPNQLSKHGIAVSSARAGNVIGGGDYAEDRILPDCVRAFRSDERVLLRNPQATRPWQHVLEPLSGYLRLGESLLGKNKKEFCDGWNFGPDPKVVLTVCEVVDQFTKAWNKSLPKNRKPARGWEKASEKNSPHEAKLLKLNIDKAKKHLHWQPIWNVKEAIEATAQWYSAFEVSNRKSGLMDELTRSQIQKYEEGL